MQRALEEYKWFQVVAWVLVFSITFFTIVLTHQLKEAVETYSIETGQILE